jgi:hypothetical protein
MKPAPATIAPINRPISSLREVLAYRHEALLQRFAEKTGLTRREANQIFTQTKKWLWLCGKHRREHQADKRRGPTLAINSTMLIIDEMWHEFILFTLDYSAFCARFLGGYIHHAPTTHAEKDQAKRDFASSPKRVVSTYKRELREFYSYVYDNLGEETLLTWTTVLPGKYPKPSGILPWKPSPTSSRHEAARAIGTTTKCRSTRRDEQTVTRTR